MKYTIKDLAKGRVILINDSTFEDLIKVLSEAFPQAKEAKVQKRFYVRASYPPSTDYHMSDNYYSIGRDLPTQSVKDFLEPEFKWGEKVEVRDRETLDHIQATFIAENPDKDTEYKYVVKTPSGKFFAYKQIRKIEQPKVLELTLEEIAAKFNISVDQLKIKK